MTLMDIKKYCYDNPLFRIEKLLSDYKGQSKRCLQIIKTHFYLQEVKPKHDPQESRISEQG